MANINVAANPATASAGAPVGLTATVQPGKALIKPTGTIRFMDGDTALNTSPLLLASNTFNSTTFQQTFGALDPTLAASSPEMLTGDLNGDGVADLLVYAWVFSGSQWSLTVQAFVSNSDKGYSPGTSQNFAFSRGSLYPSVEVVPAVIDLNADGKLDLLGGSQVAYGNGDGSFGSPVPVSFLTNDFVTSYPADINGDGKTDLLAVNMGSVANGDNRYAITAFLNQGGGTFASAGTSQIGVSGLAALHVYQPAFIDFNGDGKLDLILQWGVTDAGAPELDTLLNNGDGAFTSPTSFFVDDPNLYEENTSYQIGSGDVNSDGKQDLILVMGDNTDSVSAITILGKGDGSFAAPLYFPFSNTLRTAPVVVQDVNLDGKLDLVFGDGQFATGNGDGTYSAGAPLFSPPAYSDALASILLPGSAVPSLIFLSVEQPPTPTSVFTPQIESSASLSVSQLAVGTHTISVNYSGDSNYAASSSPPFVVTITQVASVATLTSSANPSISGQSVTFTANVTSSGPPPTGNIVFNSGSTLLSTVALSAGSASYKTSSFTNPGSQTITASYSGDANTQPFSTTLNQMVNAAIVVGSSSTTLTVKAGQAVTAPVNVSGAAGFSGQVTFACSGLPANSSCSFSPATVTVSGTTPVSTQLSVNTAASMSMAASLPVQGQGWRIGTASGLGLAGLMLLWPIKRRRTHLWLAMICAIAVASMGMTGCGGGGSAAPKTTKGTYSFIVTASSAKVQTQSSYTLVVQ